MCWDDGTPVKRIAEELRASGQAGPAVGGFKFITASTSGSFDSFTFTRVGAAPELDMQITSVIRFTPDVVEFTHSLESFVGTTVARGFSKATRASIRTKSHQPAAR